MKCIYRYAVEPRSEPQNITTPAGAHPIHIGQSIDGLSIWMEVDPEAPEGDTDFMVIGTGWAYDEAEWEYVATYTTPSAYVWHLLRRTPSKED